MALEYELIHSHKGARPMGETIRVNQHWYLTEDKTQVVAEGVPGGRWLWASPGQEVNRAEAERLGAVPRPEPDPDPAGEEPADEPAPKQRRPPASKQRAKPEDK